LFKVEANTMNEDDAFRFMRSQRLAVISTTHPTGSPQAALIGYAFDLSVGLVFDTSASSRKARNLRLRPLAALVIGWDDETTLQMEGAATEPAGDALGKAKAVYFHSWPDGRSRETSQDITYFVINPHWMRFSRYSGAPTIAEFNM
jgi:pyridoxine/pyridoxamine 5'-phosphate oxidase